jgi:hypothetical protein
LPTPITPSMATYMDRLRSVVSAKDTIKPPVAMSVIVPKMVKSG